MTINPKNANPDQPYEVDLDGERHVAMRNNPRQEHSEWRLLPEPGVQALWAGDGAVKNLTPLVPARPFTRDDLPSTAWLCRGLPEESEARYWTAHTLTKVLEHLNANGGIPAVSGKSCCEDAALNAAEVDRLTRERDEWESKYWDMRDDRNAEDVKRLAAESARADLEDERYELQRKLDDPYSEVNQKAAAWDRVDAHPVIGKLSELPEGDSYAERVCKRLDQLADMEATINELAPADPAWLGDVPEKPKVKRIVGDTWEVDGLRSQVTWSAEEFRCDGYRRIALAAAIEAEEAERNDDQRVEEAAKAIHKSGPHSVSWHELSENLRRMHRSDAERLLNAGWSPPESEASE